MRSVDIAAWKCRLIEHLQRVANGETVPVTDRDRIIAEIRPLRTTRNPFPAAAMLADTVRKGWLTPARSLWAPTSPGRPTGGHAVRVAR